MQIWLITTAEIIKTRYAFPPEYSFYKIKPPEPTPRLARPTKNQEPKSLL